MKNCEECKKEFQEKVSFEKYCTIECLKRFHNRKRREKLRSDPEFRALRNKKEVARRHKKRQQDPIERKKHNDQEKARYRRKHGINCDSDLKCAPKGSGTLTSYGYRQIIRRGHPNSRKNGGMFEHVFIMAEHLKRSLRKGETVHHRNGIKHDNRIENLELWCSSHPYGQRVEDKIKWCKEFLATYGFEVVKRN